MSSNKSLGNDGLTKEFYVCFFKDVGQYLTGESVRLIKVVLEFTDHEKIEAILFSADLEKAFDSIDHCFLFSSRKCFGFVDDFIQWVITLVNNVKSYVMNNGHSTGYSLREGNQTRRSSFCLSLFLRWKYYLYRLEIIPKFMELKLTTLR